jgi:hypothetical protein
LSPKGEDLKHEHGEKHDPANDSSHDDITHDQLDQPREYDCSDQSVAQLLQKPAQTGDRLLGAYEPASSITLWFPPSVGQLVTLR